MKKAILLTLTALLLLSSMTACGSKDRVDVNSETESRVLYPDDDVSSSEESEEEETSESEEVQTDDTDTADTESETVASSEKSSDTASKKASSSTSSKTTSSKKTVTTTSSTASKKTITTSSTAPSNTGAAITHGDNPASNTANTNSSGTSSENEQNNSGSSTDTEPQVIGSFDESDFVVTIGGGQINFGDDIESVKAILGEILDIQEAPSCKYTGQQDKTFVFSECSINTYPNEDGSKDYVVGIVINSGDYTTAKGAKIGTTSDELISIYGNSASDDSPMRKYTIGDKTLSFYVEGDSVAEINYIWDN